MRHYIDQSVEGIKSEVGRERVILGLSGGVDSSVAAALLHKAIGDQLTCIFVNNGLLRGREAQVVRVGGCAPADEAGLKGDKPQVRLVAVAAGFRKIEHALVDLDNARGIQVWR